MKKNIFRILFVMSVSISIFSCSKQEFKENDSKEQMLDVKLKGSSEAKTENEIPPCGSEVQTDLRILFIGNSYTDNWTTKIPTMFQQLANYNGQSVSTVLSRCNLGFTLQDHANNFSTLNAINQGDWDYVILQENAGMLANQLFPQSVLQNSVSTLVNIIDNNSPDASIVLYQMVPPFDENTSNYNNTQSSWNTAFAAVASSNPMLSVVNIGQAFTNAYTGAYGFDPTPDHLRFTSTYQHHFDNSGGFLAAVSFYTAIFNNKPCIPASMNFYIGNSNANGSVNSYVTQPDILAQIGYAEALGSIRECYIADNNYYGVGQDPCQ